MSGKRHPIVMVVVLLGIAVVVLGGVMALVLSFFDPTDGFSLGDKIGVIPIEGPITDSEPVVSQLVKYKKDNKIRAIILRVDSPGGGVAPSQEIYREIRKTAKTKKVVVSMGNLAASGGYYIAAAADRIVANPGTLTGSIGVIMEFVYLKELLDKIGVNLEVIKSGEFKDIGSPHRTMTDREKALLNDLITEIQGQFIEAVATGRKLEVEKVKEIADGRLLSGSRAKDLGLVDALGNFRDAVDLTKKLAGIEGDATLVFPEKPHLPLWDLIVGDAADALCTALGRVLEHRMVLKY